MKIAIVYDRVNKFGGAERILLALHEIWPDAPLFTSVYEQKDAPWANVFDVQTSFLQSIPFARRHHELFPWLTPLVFESYFFDGFDVVVSVTSAEAKGIITKPETLHICYCLTPTRYLWSGYDEYIAHPGMGKLGTLAPKFLKRLAPTLRSWDLIASSRPDRYIAISKQVKDRIERYYHRYVDSVIYPPVDLDQFRIQEGEEGIEGDYYLTVSRLVGYKRIDIIIDAFNELGLPLKIIGYGRAYHELKLRAKANIEFVTHRLTDSELNRYYQRCRAFVFAGQEDFGIVAGEALACGKPIICYKQSGMAELVHDGKTGVLFPEQSVESLMAAIGRFSKMHYNKESCRQSVAMLDTRVFQKEMKTFVERSFAARKDKKI